MTLTWKFEVSDYQCAVAPKHETRKISGLEHNSSRILRGIAKLSSEIAEGVQMGIEASIKRKFR
jgi:hypothetical protein